MENDGMVKRWKAQFREMFLAPGAETPIEECRALLAQQDGEGRFPDVDYGDKQPNSWAVRRHFERTVRIWSNREVQSDPALRAQAMRGLDFWIFAGFENPNWWHNEIGQPMLLGTAALLAEPWLGAAQRERVLAILTRGSLYTRPELYRLWNGANLLWGVVTTLCHAMLTDDPDVAAEALSRAEKELFVTEGGRDGIKADHSFFQHQTQLYSGGYGRSFVIEVSRIMYVLHGTPRQFSAAALAGFADFLLDGEQWLLCRDAWDFNVIGREIARPDGIVNPPFSAALSLLCRVEELPRREELSAFAARVSGEGTALSGDRAFPIGRLYVSRRGGRYIGTRVTDPGQMLGETINGENFYSADLYGGGVTCQMSDPSAYDRLPPVWDNCFMPGVTARVEDDAALMEKRALWHGRFGQNRCGRVCRLSDRDGCTFQDVAYNGITGVIARFFADGVMLALGAGLCADGAEPIVTAIEQCRIRGEAKTLSLPRGEALYADGFLYAVLDQKPLFRREETRTGSWQRINVSCPDPPETAAVRTLWLAHGSAPKNASYAYAVVPGDTPGETAATLLALSVWVNTPQVQAIAAPGRVLAVFHTDAALTLPNGSTVQGKAGEALSLPC